MFRVNKEIIFRIIIDPAFSSSLHEIPEASSHKKCPSAAWVHGRSNMTSMINSIMTKLTAGFVILVLVISGLTFLFTYGASSGKIQESTQQELLALASITAADLNGNEIAKLQPGMESEVLYIMNAEQLAKMAKSDPDIVKIYTLRNGSSDIEYVVDSGYNTGKRNFRIGDVESTPTGAMKDAFSERQVEPEFVNRPWGTVLAAYAPIKDAKGQVIGIVGVDMDAGVVQGRMNFVGQTIYLILILGIICAGLIIAVFSRTMIRDIHILIDSANRISRGETDVTISISRNDEIGELASSFKRMVTSLKILMHQDYQE
ncbi:HAMP domain-containing protein [Methanospirillum lacunae]|uniref:histidine kinase n=1 Tax=Methanospirillum lacunae TaxID=668570 RepID=A0A2V2N0M5_9EURY|nr:HAMP domain-containing protein [Methanospirillum lacunae]PWR72160.1 HAMP domain-containing protein [Methanospirillum lacunae]